jgi:hypothetical protein
MFENMNITRRSFLRIAGIGTTILLTGCAGSIKDLPEEAEDAASVAWILDNHPGTLFYTVQQGGTYKALIAIPPKREFDTRTWHPCPKEQAAYVENLMLKVYPNEYKAHYWKGVYRRGTGLFAYVLTSVKGLYIKFDDERLFIDGDDVAAGGTGVGGPGCFAPYTNVLTPRGYVPIAAVSAQDVVLAYDFSRGQTVPTRVRKAWPVTEHERYLRIGSLAVTETQPFFAGKGLLRRASNLASGDAVWGLLPKEGRAGPVGVGRITRVNPGGRERYPFHDITVEHPDHNLIVGFVHPRVGACNLVVPNKGSAAGDDAM